MSFILFLVQYWLIIPVVHFASSGQQIFLELLRETLIELGKNNNTIVLGDFNIDYRQISTKSNKELRLLAREFNLTHI